MKIIEDFFSYLRANDAESLMKCYADDAVYFNPLSDLVQQPAIELVWKTFMDDAAGLEITWAVVEDKGEGYYACKWQASFNHTLTGKKVVMPVAAYFKCANNLIAEHSDGFSLHQYSAQAFGFPATIIGWNSYYQKKIKLKYRKRLLQLAS